VNEQASADPKALLLDAIAAATERFARQPAAPRTAPAAAAVPTPTAAAPTARASNAAVASPRVPPAAAEPLTPTRVAAPSTPPAGPSVMQLRFFTPAAHKLVADAQRLADQQQHAMVTPLHVLAAALELSALQRGMRSCGADVDACRRSVRLALSETAPRRGEPAYVEARLLTLLQTLETDGEMAGHTTVVHVLRALSAQHGPGWHVLGIALQAATACAKQLEQTSSELKLERYSRGARFVLAGAQTLADERRDAEATPYHLAFRMLALEPIQRDMRARGIDVEEVRQRCKAGLSRGARSSEASCLSPALLAVLARAERNTFASAEIGLLELIEALAGDDEATVRDVAALLHPAGRR
jgi:ATP-dependent Clp protease ATP-binding subunit ClpA